MPRSEEEKRTYKKNWFQENKHRIYKNYRQKWSLQSELGRENHRNKKREYKQNNFRAFLSLALSYSKRNKEKCGVDIDYLLDLLKTQNECCAACGLPLLHVVGNLQSVSIDRIDSSLGYIEGNIQLVCKFINLGKSTYSNEEVKNFLNKYCKSRSEGQI